MTLSCPSVLQQDDGRAVPCDLPPHAGSKHAAVVCKQVTWEDDVVDVRTHWQHLVECHMHTSTDPLRDVLQEVSWASGEPDPRYRLARIVAICKQKTGQEITPYPPSEVTFTLADHGTVGHLLFQFFSHPDPDDSCFTGLGRWAATWLTHLTGEAP